MIININEYKEKVINDLTLEIKDFFNSFFSSQGLRITKVEKLFNERFLNNNDFFVEKVLNDNDNNNNFNKINIKGNLLYIYTKSMLELVYEYHFDFSSYKNYIIKINYESNGKDVSNDFYFEKYYKFEIYYFYLRLRDFIVDEKNISDEIKLKIISELIIYSI